MVLGDQSLRPCKLVRKRIWKEKENLAPTDRRPVQGTLTTYISSRDYHSTYLCGSANLYKLFSHNNIYVMGNRKSGGEIQYMCCSCVRFPTCHVPPCTYRNDPSFRLGHQHHGTGSCDKCPMGTRSDQILCFFSKTYEQKLLPSHMVLINVSMDAQGSSGASIFTLALFWNFTCVARLEICTHLYGTLVPNFTLITPPIFKYVKLVS
jgi:hypothetical protein